MVVGRKFDCVLVHLGDCKWKGLVKSSGKSSWPHVVVWPYGGFRSSPRVNCRICLCLKSNSCKPADFRQLLQFTCGQVPWALRSSPTQAASNYHDEMGGNKITKFCFVTPFITCLPTKHVSGQGTTGVCGLCKWSWQASPSLVSVVVGQVITCPLE